MATLREIVEQAQAGLPTKEPGYSVVGIDHGTEEPVWAAGEPRSSPSFDELAQLTQKGFQEAELRHNKRLEELGRRFGASLAKSINDRKLFKPIALGKALDDFQKRSDDMVDALTLLFSQSMRDVTNRGDE